MWTIGGFRPATRPQTATRRSFPPRPKPLSVSTTHDPEVVGISPRLDTPSRQGARATRRPEAGTRQASRYALALRLGLFDDLGRAARRPLGRPRSAAARA